MKFRIKNESFLLFEGIAQEKLADQNKNLKQTLEDVCVYV